jgi:hypothetical protein
MTTVDEIQSMCAVCGEGNVHLVVLSTNTFMGTPDLDTRPPDMERSTMPYWLVRCQFCGYVYPSDPGVLDASNEPELRSEVVLALVGGVEYQTQLHDESFPDLANNFLCQSMIEEQLGALADAGWSSLHAAWACDDDGRADAADRCRGRAAGLWQSAQAAGERFAGEDRGAEEAILADLYRRMGRSEDALEQCRRGLASNPPGLIKEILDYGRALTEKGDRLCHTLEEIVGSELNSD